MNKYLLTLVITRYSRTEELSTMFIRSSKELALLIVNRRKKLNLSQTAVAKLVGLKQQTVSEFENKPDSTKLATLFKILSAVKLDASVLAKEDQLVAESQWNEEW